MTAAANGRTKTAYITKDDITSQHHLDAFRVSARTTDSNLGPSSSGVYRQISHTGKGLFEQVTHPGYSTRLTLFVCGNLIFMGCYKRMGREQK